MLQLQHKIWSQTFSCILKGNQFSKLSVQEICDLTQIHRSSFYRAFSDKFAVLEFGIDLLWHDYFDSLTVDDLLNPFTSSDRFFNHSLAKDLLYSQQADSQVLNDVKKITLNLLKKAYHGIFIEDEEHLISGYICASIDYIDLWNQSLTHPYSIAQLDLRFKQVVLDSITPLF